MSHVAYMNESRHMYEWVVGAKDALWAMLQSHFMSYVKWVYQSWHISMSHGTYEWVMAYMNKSWHIWMFRGTYEWVMAHMNVSWHTWMSHWRKGSSMCNIVMSFYDSCQMDLLVTNFVSRTKFVIHTQNSWIIGKKEPGCRDLIFRTCQMSLWIMAHMNDSRRISEWVTSHTWLVTSHIWMSHVYESWHTLLSHGYKRFICAGVGMSWGKKSRQPNSFFWNKIRDQPVFCSLVQGGKGS